MRRAVGAAAAAVAAAVAAATVLVAAPPAPAASAWTARPAAGGGRPHAYLEGPAGTPLEDALSLTNPGARPLVVRLRASAPWAAWVRFAADPVTVPPRTRADVPFTVTVPPGTPPGDLSGTLTATAAGRDVAVPVRLRVAGPRLAALTVEDVRVEDDAIRYTLVNRGNTALTPRVEIRTDGLLGAPRTLDGPPPGPPLLPGARRTATHPWPRPTLDRVTLHLNATAGNAARATATHTYTPGPARAAAWTAAAATTALATWGVLLMRRRRAGARR
ncbi:hypothetical protein ACFPM3_21195 [Streptomyces coeruleoprunus]|uniref:DUF916 domain-containing protein n=1 Tax=Streptomyces coeruleoprunus TaxID=285563 RepID=A0ABV9XGX6_9ACTN